ncbi:MULTISPECIES: winged helix-turn-helix domain-containing protein [unclassified Serratia (in: enterobacteria)]|uniref:winged helix-turn-helix domain-containing protein n=1 Tax=unclassified Serratia (in: enterobacteria) TaxID=2647522 RepID=UPI002ECFBC45|nr:helix-turn-helix domain-containing protein [Serratia sp. C2(2)]MEE4447635.1 helix-turn-helix domain-containing protein [Serratia sp. C2(1)]
MKYIINKIVVFNSEELTLCLYENNQVVTRLTKPASRLLLELIQNNRKNITRDDLMERVWTTYGFTASNAGLNNYISELRKEFALLGIKEIIITIPKVGFRFEVDIDFMDDIAQRTKAPVILEAVAQPENGVVLHKKNRMYTPGLLPYKKWLLIASGLVIIFIFSGVNLLKGKNDESYPYQRISKIDNCEIYTIGEIDNGNNLLLKIKNTLKQQKIDCAQTHADIFYMEEIASKKMVRSDLISICNKNKKNHYDTCFNIKNLRNTSK